jgi:two-component system chemotaxis response regulator CheY
VLPGGADLSLGAAEKRALGREIEAAGKAPYTEPRTPYEQPLSGMRTTRILLRLEELHLFLSGNQPKSTRSHPTWKSRAGPPGFREWDFSNIPLKLPTPLETAQRIVRSEACDRRRVCRKFTLGKPAAVGCGVKQLLLSGGTTLRPRGYKENKAVVDRNMHILVVDDLKSMRTEVKDLLRQMGFKQIIEAQDGKEAMSLLETTPVDFIISDWNMPNADGLELLRHVRNHVAYGDLPFLMVTAVAERNNVLEAVEAKVSNYIVKPFAPETLEKKIRAIFRCSEPLWEVGRGCD